MAYNDDDIPKLPQGGFTGTEMLILCGGIAAVAGGVFALFSGYLTPSWSTLTILLLVIVGIVCVRMRLYGAAINVGLLIAAMIILLTILSKIPVINLFL